MNFCSFILFNFGLGQLQEICHLVWPLVSGEYLVDMVESAREYKVVVVEGNVIVIIKVDHVFVVDFLYFFVGVYDLDV